jgi:hypothetical protein
MQIVVQKNDGKTIFLLCYVHQAKEPMTPRFVAAKRNTSGLSTLDHDAKADGELRLRHVRNARRLSRSLALKFHDSSHYPRP